MPVHIRREHVHVQRVAAVPGQGRVHEVGLGALVQDEARNHFLAEADADANMGNKALLEGSRSGPFRSSTGPSRVMDRSAHVLYRRRGPTIEITVKRGVTSYELDTLTGKLAAHRLSTHDTHVFFVDGRRRKIGKLIDVNLQALRSMITETLVKRTQVGIEITDERKQGILHKPTGHTRRTKYNMRHKKKFANALS